MGLIAKGFNAKSLIFIQNFVSYSTVYSACEWRKTSQSKGIYYVDEGRTMSTASYLRCSFNLSILFLKINNTQCFHLNKYNIVYLLYYSNIVE